ncbi:hypothetical protein BHE74_00000749 [Ensete ventricosum]|nr:hypothetical protein BHE74_00000749 [Ensete ventricosum]
MRLNHVELFYTFLCFRSEERGRSAIAKPSIRAAGHNQALYRGDRLRAGPLQGWSHVAKAANKGGCSRLARKGWRIPAVNAHGVGDHPPEGAQRYHLRRGGDNGATRGRARVRVSFHWSKDDAVGNLPGVRRELAEGIGSLPGWRKGVHRKKIETHRNIVRGSRNAYREFSNGYTVGELRLYRHRLSFWAAIGDYTTPDFGKLSAVVPPILKFSRYV